MLFLVIHFVVVAYSFLKLWIARKPLPPGPLPLPFIGNLHQLLYKMIVQKKDFAEAMKDFVRDFGAVHTFWFGPVATVQICDYANAADAMIKNGTMFVNRALPYLLESSRGGKGLMASKNEFWAEQRRFCLHTIRNLGMGKNSMEQRIMHEVDITCEEIENRLVDGEVSFDAGLMFDLLTGNVIHRLVLTDRFEKSDEETFFTLKMKLDNIFDDFEIYDLLISEWTVMLPLLRSRAKTLLKSQDDLIDFLVKQVEKRKKDIAEGIHLVEGEGNDFVDAFLLQMESDRKAGLITSFDEESLSQTVLDLWAAGQETTATTLKWAFAYLLLHPEVKAKVEEELQHVTQSIRPLSLNDKANTPYYNAVLTEINRCAAIFPMNLSRRAKENTFIGEFMIPKGTPINIQLSLIMSDTTYFKEPTKEMATLRRSPVIQDMALDLELITICRISDECPQSGHLSFNPDRFMNDEKLEQYVIPFGLGRRNCLGETIARSELYLAIGNILLRFLVSSDPANMPSTEAKSKVGVVRKAAPYNIVFRKRI